MSTLKEQLGLKFDWLHIEKDDYHARHANTIYVRVTQVNNRPAVVIVHGTNCVIQEDLDELVEHLIDANTIRCAWNKEKGIQE